VQGLKEEAPTLRQGNRGFHQECGLPWSPLVTPVTQSGHPAKFW
jgi:hypothetical protein